MRIKVKTLKLLLYVTLAGLVLMAGLIVTGLTLASRYSQATVTEQVGIEAMMSLSPTYGGANTFVNITGIGFPHDSRVRLYLTPPDAVLPPQPHAETFADDEGRFSVMFPMPTAWPDGTPVTDETLVMVALSEDGGVRASAVFDFMPPVIQPEINVTPTIGGGGTPVTVSSVGFPAGSRVTLHLGPPEGGFGPQAYAEGVADSEGRVTLSFVMPENWPDGSRVKEEQLEIVALTDDNLVRASAGFDYEPIPYPLITVSPNYGGPGTPVSITGDGYRAGVRVLIKLGTSVDDAAGREAYIETMADTRGNINVPFTMPGKWPGGLPILVRDVVVLATSADQSGYGWMGFAYLDHEPEEPAGQGSGTSEDEGEDEGEVVDEEPTEASTPKPKKKQEQAPAADAAPPLPEPDTDASTEPSPELDVVPEIILSPANGGAQTLVTVTGSGFPAGVEVFVHLGVPGVDADPDVYGEALTDETGSFSITFTLPATWPDGTDITENELVVVVATQDGTVAASATFSFIPEVEAEVETEVEVEP